MPTDLLSILPSLPIGPEAALVVSALLVSVTVALIALIRNRRALQTGVDDESDLGTIFENPSSVLPHIVELRQRVVASVIGIVVATILAAALTPQVLVILAEPIGGLDKLLLYKVTEGVGVYVRIAVTVGIILASPYVIAQLWIFIASGLRSSEQRIFYLMFPFAAILFLAGVAFSYFMMLPVAVPFLVTFLDIQATPTLEDYIQFVTSVMLWVGVSFEMPLVMFGLAKAGIVNAGMLARNWRIAIVGIALMAALVTPTPDPVNMGIVAAPLIILYILSIGLTLLA